MKDTVTRLRQTLRSLWAVCQEHEPMTASLAADVLVEIGSRRAVDALEAVVEDTLSRQCLRQAQQIAVLTAERDAATAQADELRSQIAGLRAEVKGMQRAFAALGGDQCAA